VYLPIKKIGRQFEHNHVDPEECLRNFIGDIDYDYEAFWEKVKTNLQAGRIRLLFVADEIPAELRRIVEFLNKNMPTVEVLAVEMKQYVDSDKKLTTLVPRVVGQTAETQRYKSINATTSKKLDEESFFSAISVLGEQQYATALKIYEWANRNVKWGSASSSPLDSARRPPSLSMQREKWKLTFLLMIEGYRSTKKI
jgi:hypothetical protein